MKIKTGRYIDPLTDWGFKHLFGSEPNKDILKDLLNELFKGEKYIADIIYKPTEHGGDQRDSRKAIFDLRCTGDNGEQFIVEMQRGKQEFFRERCVFYTSRLIQDQLPAGGESNRFDLPEVYLIAVLEFSIDIGAGKQYLHDICLMDKGSGAIFYKKLGYKFLDLPNFNKAEADLQTDLERWFYLLKNMSRLDRVPVYFSKRVFQKIFQIAEVSKLTKEERMLYEKSLEEKWDYENVLAYAVKEAEEKGIEKGIEKGREEGAYLKTLTLARKMKANGLSVKAIADITDLSIEEIEKL